ncbi:WXG100 family type VII secretion target [Nocardia testacea]|uniref:PPE domain-containing protein n=1 Tax=Nocardia testacea TaxID=248551 RepID=A0ABW7W797_9NOCA
MRELPRAGSRGVHYRVDPEYAPTVEVFDNLTHRQIHAGVAAMNPSVLQTGGQAWQGAATGLTDAVAQAHTEIRGAIADGWRGPAAGLAAAAVRDFEAAGRHLADVLATVGQRLGRAGDAAETLRAAVPEPSGAEPDLAAALLDRHAATGNIAVQRSADDDRAEVVRVMDSVYTGAFIPTGAQVPAFPDLPDAVSGAEVPRGAAPAAPAVPGPDTAVGQRPSSAPAAMPVADRQPGSAPAGGAVPDEPISPAVAAAGGRSDALDLAPAGSGSEHTSAAATRPSVAPATAPAAAAPVGAAPASPAAATGVPLFAAPVRPAGSTGDQERSREEQQRSTGGEAVTGMGAGAIGGLMGGAMAADTVRSGSPVAPRAERTGPAEEDFHFADEELTYLEPGEPAGQLIGALEPTTPPVLGEWTEEE